MKTSYGEREVLIDTEETAQFGMEANYKAFKILFDGLYQNKIESVTREIWSNALDAHVENGNEDEPFEVSFPSVFDPSFRVRDYGISLSHEQVMKMYTTAFHSTKEGTDLQVGKFGLGSKSPFAYTDNFSVTVVKDSEKRFYSAMIGQDLMPRIHLMGREETDEDNGVEVSFPVKDKDFDAFQRAAHRVSLGFGVKPIVTGGGAAKFGKWAKFEVEYETDDFVLISGTPQGMSTHSIYAQMGCVIYPVDSDLLNQDLVSHFVKERNRVFLLKMPVGSMEPSASREGLSYGSMDPTVDSLNAKLQLVADTILDPFKERVKNAPNRYAQMQILGDLHRSFENLSRGFVQECYDAMQPNTCFFPYRNRWITLAGDRVEKRNIDFQVIPTRSSDDTVKTPTLYPRSWSDISGRLHGTVKTNGTLSFMAASNIIPLIIIRDLRNGVDGIKNINDRMKQEVYRRAQAFAANLDPNVRHQFTITMMCYDFMSGDISQLYNLIDQIGCDDAFIMAEDLPYDAPVRKSVKDDPDYVKPNPQVNIVRVRDSTHVGYRSSMSGMFRNFDREQFFSKFPEGVYCELERGQYWDFPAGEPCEHMGCRQVMEILAGADEFLHLQMVYVPKSGSGAFRSNPKWKSVQEFLKDIYQEDKIRSTMGAMITLAAEKKAANQLHRKVFSNAWHRNYITVDAFALAFDGYKGAFARWYRLLSQDPVKRSTTTANIYHALNMTPKDIDTMIDQKADSIVDTFNKQYPTLDQINTPYETSPYILMIKATDKQVELERRLRTAKNLLTKDKKRHTTRNMTLKRNKAKGALQCA